jgi:hypothetical protein
LTDKPQVHTIFVQVRAPKGPGDYGAAVEGAYIVVDGAVTLTDRNGNAVKDQHGKSYSRKISDGETARAVAVRLTKDLRSILRGKDGRVNGFDRPIRYPKGNFFI